jgi:hypothetical protein
MTTIEEGYLFGMVQLAASHVKRYQRHDHLREMTKAVILLLLEYEKAEKEELLR